MAYKVCILVLLSAFLLEGTAGQSSGCTSTLMGLSPCLNYVSGNASTPSSSCCTQLTSVVQTQPQCLCLLLNGTASNYGFNINQTLALALPGACNVQTPPTSRCNAANVPATSPSQKTPPSSNTAGAGSNVPSGSKSTPADTPNSGSNIKASFNAAVFLVLIASYAVVSKF